ncbi:MAG TPA: lactate racemase domain-containing protein [Gemmatimonadaceae bacterium]|nr:lactate racemase domain-containing protein [Gemmatimonadaceae bacterium]
MSEAKDRAGRDGARPPATTVEVFSGAWSGDRRLALTFPSSWDVQVIGRSPGPPIGPDAMRERLRTPIGSPGLATLARGCRSAVIIIDDISRPTPTAELLPLVLEELEGGGMPASRVRVVIAAGGHERASHEDNLKKVGVEVAARVAFEAHDPDGNLVYAGKSPVGIPLYINPTVMAADLKIGIGSINPHDWAGFSGGSKIIVPGVAGIRTARYLHDFVKGARRRGGDVANDFRRELDAISGALGLDFIVNVILDHGRRIVALFAGDRVLAHREGAEVAAARFAVPPVPADAQIVVANTHPFDANLLFVSWGLWPLTSAPPGATKVALIDGTQGVGTHRLKPLDHSPLERAWMRLLTVRPRHLWRQARHLFVSLRRTRRRRALQFLALCPNMSGEDLAKRFPAATRFRNWDELLFALRRKHGEGRVKVAIYPCAPLQVPVESERDGREAAWSASRSSVEAGAAAHG